MRNKNSRRYVIATLALLATNGSVSGQDRILLVAPNQQATWEDGSQSTLTPSVLEESSATEALSLREIPITVPTTIVESQSIDGSAIPSKDGSSEPQLIRDRNASGQVIVERWVVESESGDYVNDGVYTSFDASGKPARTGRFEMGQRVGEWKQSLTATQVTQLVPNLERTFQAPFLSRVHFIAGQLDGEWTIVDANGRPVVAWSFASGLRQGESIWFGAKGEPIQSIQYENNIPNGPAVMAGVTSDAGVSFVQGSLLQKVETWYDGNRKTQKKTEEWVLAPANLSIVSQDWEASVVTYARNTDTQTVRHGSVVTWYSNGQKGHQGNYEKGIPVGEFSWWYPTGQLQSRGNYADGVQQGDWIWWHENGMKKVQGSFERGERIGTWSQWRASGELVARAEGIEFAEVDAPQITEVPAAKRPVNSARLRVHRHSTSR